MEQIQQQKTINMLYLLLVIASVLSFVPLLTAQVFAPLLILLVLIAGYIYRGKDEEGGLLYNHMTYMIRTIWIGSTFLTLGIVAAGLYMYLQGDHSLIQQAADEISAGHVPTEADMTNLTLNYMYANKSVLILSTGVFIGPAILYFIYRIANGYARAIKGYRIANPKSWF